MNTRASIIPLRAPVIRRNFCGWLALIAMLLLWLTPAAAQSDQRWVAPGPDGRMHVQLYFFWSETCPHGFSSRPSRPPAPG